MMRNVRLLLAWVTMLMAAGFGTGGPPAPSSSGTLQTLVFALFLIPFAGFLIWLIQRLIEKCEVRVDEKLDDLEKAVDEKIESLKEAHKKLEKAIAGTHKHLRRLGDGLNTRVSRMEGSIKYVAYASVHEQKVIASGPNLGKVITEAADKGVSNPVIIAKSPDESRAKKAE